VDFQFYLQDPTDPETEYLYEAIISAATDASAWKGIYAFASHGGVNHLIEDPIVHDFMRKGGEIDLLVGIDAITNRQTLERLQMLERRHRRFRPRVFWNDSQGLFHPKISHFSYADGRETLIVGSGNLTPGGLMHNFEGYSVISAETGEHLDMSSLNAFLTRNEANIRSIDDEVLARAALNLVRPIAGAVRPPIPGRRLKKGKLIIPRRAVVTSAAVFDRILIAQVPKAGDRWAQVHFNTDVIERYFRISDLKTQRVYLSRMDETGRRGDEEVRPCVYAVSNKNHKIEIAAAKGLDYPTRGHPILIFKERQVRCFDYMLLMPDQAGYGPLLRLTETLPSIGRGFRRVITNLPTLEKAWPECPLLTLSTEEEKDI
jgi:HKD family nuclease